MASEVGKVLPLLVVLLACHSPLPEEVVHACNVIVFFVWRGHQAFVTEAVPLDELLHEEALGLTGIRKVGVP